MTGQDQLFGSGPGSIDHVTTAIVLLLTTLAVGIVLDQLLRLRKWLQKPPPRQEPGDDESTPK
jgi:hypothetical protein